MADRDEATEEGFPVLTLHTREERNKKVNHDISWLVKLEPKIIEQINHYINCSSYPEKVGIIKTRHKQRVNEHIILVGLKERNS